jgi:hypothetical protein
LRRIREIQENAWQLSAYNRRTPKDAVDVDLFARAEGEAVEGAGDFGAGYAANAVWPDLSVGKVATRRG